MLGTSVALLGDDHLGEGPVWRARERVLTHVDITAGALHRWDWATGTRSERRLGAPIGFAVPRASGGTVLGQGRAVVLLDGDDRDGGVLCAVEPDQPGNRFNDAKCDPAGRLWAGTMSTTREPGVAALYRIEPDGACARMVAGTTISNGLGWSADGERMYFIDSTTQRIDRFDFDVAAGTLSGRRPFAQIAPQDGLPDGLAVDVEDGLWVALFGGGALHHYAADGTLDAVIALPVTNPTCPVFAGSRLDQLIVTTARHRLTAEQAAREPLAGSLLRLTPPVGGRRPFRFAG